MMVRGAGIVSILLLASDLLPPRLFAIEPSGSGRPPNSLKEKIRTPKSEFTELDATVYRRFCINCHDQDGRGEIGRELFPKIPDFTDARWQNSQTDDRLRHAILEGSGKSMPPMKAKLRQADMAPMIRLVRAFAGRGLVIADDDTAKNTSESTKFLQPLGPFREPDRRVQVERGERQVYQKSCVACHGPDGKGSLIRETMPEIPDFSLVSWQRLRTRSQLTVSILDGKRSHMPAFRDRLSSEQSQALVHVVRSFAPQQSRPADAGMDEFDAKFNKLQQELDDYRRQFHASLSAAPRDQNAPHRSR